MNYILFITLCLMVIFASIIFIRDIVPFVTEIFSGHSIGFNNKQYMTFKKYLTADVCAAMNKICDEI